MDHQQAAESMTVEKYLLDELSLEMRDQFEEHYFDCQECATDLRATAAFMDATKQEFRLNPVSKPKAPASSKPLIALLRPGLAWSALAASLLVIGYQKAVVFPRLTNEVAALKAPEILPSLSLVGGNSRGGQVPALIVVPGKPFLLLLDIPTQDSFTSYTCLLYSPSGTLAWQVDVSAQAARDTVSIRVPANEAHSGAFVLKVRGKTGENAVDLAQYHFNLKSQD